MKGWRLLPLLASAALLLSACSSSPGPSSTPQRGANDASLEGAIVEQRWNLLLVGTDERLSMPETPFFQISKEGPQMGDAKRVTDMLETAYRYLIDHDRLVFFGPDSRVLGGWREGN